MSRKTSARWKRDSYEEVPINLTPLIDVVFVVLIMFIVVAPLLEMEEVDLAHGRSQEMSDAMAMQNQSPLNISVRSDDSIWINKLCCSRSTNELHPTTQSCARLRRACTGLLRSEGPCRGRCRAATQQRKTSRLERKGPFSLRLGAFAFFAFFLNVPFQHSLLFIFQETPTITLWPVQ